LMVTPIKVLAALSGATTSGVFQAEILFTNRKIIEHVKSRVLFIHGF